MVPITVGGETHSLSGWARKLGVSRQLLQHRIRRAGIEAAIAMPAKRPPAPRTCSVCGKTAKVKGLCGLHYMRQRSNRPARLEWIKVRREDRLLLESLAVETNQSVAHIVAAICASLWPRRAPI